MPIFSKLPIDEVYDLINVANQGVENWIPVTKTNVLLGVPAPATVPGNSAMNTKITLSAIAGQDFIGRKEVNYRRRDMGVLFRSIVLQINRYSPNQGSTAGQNAVVFSVHNLLPIINAKYGINLTTDDVVDQNIIRGTTIEDGFYTRTVTVQTKSTSLAYTGQFALKWRGAPQDLSSMITVTDLNARMFPGGNDFVTAGHPTIVSGMAYAIDWSTFILAGVKWNSYPSGWEGASNEVVGFMTRFIDELNRLYGKGLQYASTGAPAYVYQSWAGRVVDLSTQAGRDSAPLANSKYYNRVLILTIPNADTLLGCGAGVHYIHYNV